MLKRVILGMELSRDLQTQKLVPLNRKRNLWNLQRWLVENLVGLPACASQMELIHFDSISFEYLPLVFCSMYPRTFMQRTRIIIQKFVPLCESSWFSSLSLRVVFAYRERKIGSEKRGTTEKDTENQGHSFNVKRRKTLIDLRR